VLLAIALASLWAAFELDLDPRQLIPGDGGLGVAREFFGRALDPALDYEAAFVPEGARPLLVKALDAARTTVVFAAAAMGLSLVLGLVLGPLASSAWWLHDPAGGRTALVRGLRRAGAPLAYGSVRTLIAGMRSVHELLWAVLFLAAFGINHLTAVIAIAIPYGGTLAKVFSEMIDEAPQDSAAALRALGASPVQVFAFGLLPRALPDMTAYGLYRFECALRSSAVMGFFGYPTLGYYLAASFENLHYGEVWTYLYTLVALVLLVDAWSGAIRRRLVA
jgi:phosphonate transport system permease protein